MKRDGWIFLPLLGLETSVSGKEVGIPDSS